MVEGTAGNTGIGLALVGNALGLKTVIVIPETQSDEKKDMLRLAGAELIEVPAVPYKDPNNYVKYSGRLAEELAATRAERRDLGQPVRQCRQPPGPYRDHGAGDLGPDTTARSTASSARSAPAARLPACRWVSRSKNKDVTIGLADPMGAALYNYYKHGELKSEGSSITEGIGQGRITANLEGAVIDEAYQIPDAEALPIIFDLLSEEGLCLGGSSGINVAGAIRLARDLGPGHTIVTVLCDYGTRYQSRLFNPKFLREKGLPVPAWLDQRQAAAPARVRLDFENGDIDLLQTKTWLTETDELARELDAPDLVIIDASWHMPGEGKNAHAEYLDRAYSRRASSSISTRSPIPRANSRICCRRPRNSPRACAAWASATARASWSTIRPDCSAPRGCGGPSASWASTM